MSDYIGWVITNKGRELLAKVINHETKLNITKLEIGSEYNTGNDRELTALVEPRNHFLVNSYERKDNATVEFTFIVSNRGTNGEALNREAYQIKEMGIFASDDAGNEVLYAYNKGTNGDYLPVFNGKNQIDIIEKCIITIDQQADMSVNIDNSITYVTYEGLRREFDKKVSKTDLATETEAGLVTLRQIKETVRENAPSLESYENIVNTHAKKQIYSEEGVHGLRYYDDELQVKSVAGEWETAGTGGSGNAPSNVVNPKIKVGNKKLSISWGDPGDTIVNGQTISTWRGTKLVQKVGSYPEKVNDGVLLLDNQEKDKYKETPFEIPNLINGQTYYFALFPYGDKKSVNLSHSNRLSGTPQPFKIMTVKIDMSNSNPETCVTYADDAVGMTPGSDEWDEFFGHYPCLLKATEEQGKLKRDNFRQFENGTPADIRTGDAGDVMIAFPRKGLRIDTTGDIVTVSMTDDPDNSEFKYYAHSRGEERKDKFYVGAYLSSIKNDKARSLRLKDYDPIPRNNDRINFTTDADRSRVDYPFQGRFKAQNNHPNYLAFSFYQLTFIQAMFVLKYKTLTAKNFSQNLKVYNYAPLGEADEYGMDVFGIYGSHIKSVLKIFGLEYLCGQFYAEWIDGIYMKNDVAQSKLVVTTTMAKFHTPARTSDADPNFIERGKNSYNTKGGGGVTRVGGTSELGFVPVEFGGSQTTYFCTENVKFRGGLAFFMFNIFGISFTNVNDEYRCAYRLMYL